MWTNDGKDLSSPSIYFFASSANPESIARESLKPKSQETHLQLWMNKWMNKCRYKSKSFASKTESALLLSPPTISSGWCLSPWNQVWWIEAVAFMPQRSRDVHWELTKRQSTWLDLIWLWTRCWSGKVALSPWRQASGRKKTGFQLRLASFYLMVIMEQTGVETMAYWNTLLWGVKQFH